MLSFLLNQIAELRKDILFKKISKLNSFHHYCNILWSSMKEIFQAAVCWSTNHQSDLIHLPGFIFHPWVMTLQPKTGLQTPVSIPTGKSLSPCLLTLIPDLVRLLKSLGIVVTLSFSFTSCTRYAASITFHISPSHHLAPSSSPFSWTTAASQLVILFLS